MSYLKKGLVNTLNSIKKHKLLFALLVLLQIIFVVSSLWLGTHYVLKILADTQGVIGPLEQANYDSQKLEQGMPFTPDYASIYNSYQSMLKNIAAFAGEMLAMYLVLNGSIWLLSHRMFQDKKQGKPNHKETAKKTIQFFLKAWSGVLVLFTPFVIISYYVLIHYIRLSDSFASVLLVIKILLVVKLSLYYILLAAFAAARAPSWKNFAEKTIRLSISNAQKTFPLFILIAAVLLAFFATLYAAIEYTESVALLLITGALTIIIIVLTRLFWIAGVQEIESEIPEVSEKQYN